MKGEFFIYCALIIFCILDPSIGMYVKKDTVLPFKWDFDVPVENQRVLPQRSGKSVDKIKRPFCNAFTGCGRKRSVSNSRNLDPNILPLYKALLLRTQYKHKESRL